MKKIINDLWFWETMILLTIFVSGFVEPSLWVWGLMFVGIPIMALVAIISVFLIRQSKWFCLLSIANAGFLVISIWYLNMLFSQLSIGF